MAAFSAPCLSGLIYYIKHKGINSFIISNILLSLGVRACKALNQFEEAIKMCDEGLEVSFDNVVIFHPFYGSIA